MNVITDSETLFIRFVRSSPVDLEDIRDINDSTAERDQEVERTPSMRYELSLIMLGLP